MTILNNKEEILKIINELKYKNISLYPIWCNYKNQKTGISYSEYIENIKLHENRPFVNYMRYL